jgi:hypothetical protein
VATYFIVSYAFCALAARSEVSLFAPQYLGNDPDLLWAMVTSFAKTRTMSGFVPGFLL